MSFEIVNKDLGRMKENLNAFMEQSNGQTS